MPSSSASFCMASWMTPSVEPQPISVTSASSAPHSSGGFEQRQNRFHLAHALFVHRLALVRIGELVADQHAVFIVLVGGDDVHVARRARHRARRDAAGGDLVALVAAVQRRRRAVEADHLAALDRDVEVQLRRVDARPAFGEQQVRQDDPRALELVDQVEQFGTVLKQSGIVVGATMIRG